MENLRITTRCVAFMIILAALSGIMLLVYPEPVHAQRTVTPSYSHGGYGGYHGGWYGGYRGGYRGWYGGYGGYRGWYYGGWWYPWAITIPFLPFYYSTAWIAGYPYYYADGIYYAPTAGGYMAVNPPQGQNAIS